MSMLTLDQACIISKISHGNQARWGNSGNYWLHPLRVLEIVNELGKELGVVITESCRIAAVLHDTVEDTKLTMRDLEILGAGDEVLEMMKVVTRQDGETSHQHVDRVLDSNNLFAVIIKVADSRDNGNIVVEPRNDTETYTYCIDRAMTVSPKRTELFLRRARQLARLYYDKK